jgi:phosphoesterase RecJ-like protein
MHVPAEVTAFLDAHESFTILYHIGPDGDCLGAAFSLAHALRARGKQAWVCTPEPIPETFAEFVTPADEQLTVKRVTGKALISVDTATPERINSAGDIPPQMPMLAIDHHPDNTFGSRENCTLWLDTDTPAVSVLFAELFLTEWQAELPPSALQWLLLGTFTDTGRFAHGTNLVRAHQAAAALHQAGADAAPVTEWFNRKALSDIRLKAEAYTYLEEDWGRSILFLPIPQDVYEQAGATSEQASNLMHEIRHVQDFEIAITLIEDRKCFRLSLRSRNSDLHPIAHALNGGGHSRACGARALKESDGLRFTSPDGTADVFLALGPGYNSDDAFDALIEQVQYLYDETRKA